LKRPRGEGFKKKGKGDSKTKGGGNCLTIPTLQKVRGVSREKKVCSIKVGKRKGPMGTPG